MDSHHRFKIEKNALRVYVFFIGIMMTAYCGLLCFGIRHMTAEILCLTMGYAVLCGGAWIFRMCKLTWAFIFYTYAVRLCIILQPEGYFDGVCRFGSILDIAHFVAFMTGAVLTGYFLCNLKKFINSFEYD